MKEILKLVAAITLLGTLVACTLPDGKISSSRGVCAVCGAAFLSGAGSDIDTDGLDSPLKVFHHYGIHSHQEGYLVCLYEVERTGGGKNEMEIKSTVVERIEGMRKVGDKLVFKRVSDGSHEEVSQSIANMPGRLYYVFFALWDDGKIGVDAQNPLALWGYTEDLRGVVESHKWKCQPDRAANGSQPIRSETNRVSSTAGSRR